MDREHIDGFWYFKVPCATCSRITLKKTGAYNRAIKNKLQVYCSRECSRVGISKSLKLPNIENTCLTCGKAFLSKVSHRRKAVYCSMKCFGIGKTQKQKYECEYCGKEFYRTKSNTKKFMYCSKKCCDTGLRGEKRPNWIKDRSTLEVQTYRKSTEYKEWRSRIFVRDNFTCQTCLKVGGRLNAHHIVPYIKDPNLRICMDNGITLCKECHKLAHKIMRDQEKGSTQNLVQGMHNRR